MNRNDGRPVVQELRLGVLWYEESGTLEVSSSAAYSEAADRATISGRSLGLFSILVWMNVYHPDKLVCRVDWHTGGVQNRA